MAHSGDEEVEVENRTSHQSQLIVTPGILLGVGGAILDMVFNAQAEIFEKYQVEIDTAVLAETRHMNLFDDVRQNHEPHFTLSGGTQVTVRVAQWMLQKPGAASFIGCIGMDAYGQQMKECALSDGLGGYYVEQEDQGTGVCVVMVNGPQRSLVADLASANLFKLEYLEREDSPPILDAARFIYVVGYLLTASLQSAMFLCRQCVEADKVMMLNLTAPFLIEHFTENFMAALPFCDFLFGDVDEFTTLGRVKDWGEDVIEVARKVCALPKATGTRPRVAVITQGTRPTLVVSQGTVVQFPVEKLASELVVDTNGTGDAFVGGFIAKLIQGDTMAECVRAGHWASREMLQCSGSKLPRTCDYI